MTPRDGYTCERVECLHVDVARHGILAERHAEAVTDAMRALLLEMAGYEARVVEWIALEHTAKNTMIIATRPPAAEPAGAETDAERARRAGLRRRLRALAAAHGIRRQHLAELLGEPLTDEPEAPAPARSGRSMPPVAAGFAP